MIPEIIAAQTRVAMIVFVPLPEAVYELISAVNATDAAAAAVTNAAGSALFIRSRGNRRIQSTNVITPEKSDFISTLPGCFVFVVLDADFSICLSSFPAYILLFVISYAGKLFYITYKNTAVIKFGL